MLSPSVNGGCTLRVNSVGVVDLTGVEALVEASVMVNSSFLDISAAYHYENRL